MKVSIVHISIVSLFCSYRKHLEMCGFSLIDTVRYLCMNSLGVPPCVCPFLPLSLLSFISSMLIFLLVAIRKDAMFQAGDQCAFHVLAQLSRVPVWRVCLPLPTGAHH